MANKKGAFNSAIVDFVGYLTFALVVIFFLIIFSVKSTTQVTVDEQVSEQTLDQWMINYLYTDLEVNGQTKTVYEWMGLIDYVDFSEEMKQKIAQDYFGLEGGNIDLITPEDQQKVPWALLEVFNQNGREITSYAITTGLQCRIRDGTLHPRTINIPTINGGYVTLLACERP